MSDPTSKGDQSNQVAESILNFFPGFDAFKLPPPSSDPEVVLNLNRDEVQQDVNKSFVRGVQEFKALLRSKLSPKRSFNDGEYVTGEGRWIPQPFPPYPPSLLPPPFLRSEFTKFRHTRLKLFNEHMASME